MKSLKQKALIFNLSISEWLGKRHDTRVTHEVDAAHKTSKAGYFVKNLIDLSYLSPIQKLRSQIRAYHLKNTLPWGDNGDRLLPSAHFFTYMQGIKEMMAEFDNEVNTFLGAFERIKWEAKANLNDLFNEEDYPTVPELRQKFGVYLSYEPLPDTSDFRLDDVSQSVVDDLRGQIENEVNERHRGAIRDIGERVHAAIKRIIDTLSKEEETKWHRSMIDNVEELIDIIPAFNYTGDETITRLAADLKSLIIDPDTIRDDDTVKDYVLKRSKELEQMYF